MSTFDLVGLSLPGCLDPAVPVAASRAGAVGVLDLTLSPRPGRIRGALETLLAFGRGSLGVRLDLRDTATREVALKSASGRLSWILLAGDGRPPEAGLVTLLRSEGASVAAEVTSVREVQAAEAAGVDLLLARGHETGGRVGQETAFILVQRLLQASRLPVWVQGGIGLHTAPACYAAGAAGVVLDSQLALARESALDPEVRKLLGRMDGSETACLGEGAGRSYRVYMAPGARAAEEAAAIDDPATLESAITGKAGWGSPETSIWLVGQDACFAADLAERHRSVGGIVQAIRRAVDGHVEAARRLHPLGKGSPLARSHGTEYPLVQGPMTRVSDTAEFAHDVARGGALPFLALALLRAGQVRDLMQRTRRIMGELPWGVGILGFVPLELRQEQLEVIREIKPGFALIAGGRPDQALALERDGIPTYLHVPSPGLLKLFLENGSRRFVFEGRECGGHVGPRSSFVLWNTMIDVLLESLPQGEAERCHVLFAGGIHDPRSAAMLSAMAAPLAERGVRVGALMGTAYLFTREAVGSGAIVPGFQEEAIRCSETVLLETGPGHATRCSETSFAADFLEERRRLMKEGRSPEEIRNVLEEMNLGRLRIASKGITRNPRAGSDPAAPRYLEVGEGEQHRQGMYMIGQLAAARSSVTSVAELHHGVSVEGSGLLDLLDPPDLAGRAEGRKEKPCDIAIIGMGCLLPGADSLRAYWDNILNKVDAIQEVPAHRWDWRLYYDPDPSARDKIYSKWGGFLKDHPFDPMRYGMPPNTLTSIEPLQLLTLDVVRAALEDSGYLDQPHVRPRTSVILGAGGGVADLGSQYGIRAGLPNLVEGMPEEVLQALPEWTEDSFAGILLNVAAGRVANRFDLGGSNYTVDAACASSLAAVYLAIKELESGTSDLAIAGGVDTVQNPFGYLCFSKTRALSPRGRCRTFDAGADGIVISEGLAAVVLKRLADAERDGDRIYAVIKGIASSSDGRDKGLTAPRREGQIAALERAYAKAGFSMSTVGLIEAHGTGTVAGDRAEVEALKEAFHQAEAERQSCAIGSVKSMIGHTKCTAGVASLIKVALSLHHKVIPPTLHVERPNPRANFPESPFYVSTETRPWLRSPSSPPRRGGVSAFGFGGTNFHAAIEEYLGELPGAERRAVQAGDRPELLIFRGATAGEIGAQVASLREALARGACPGHADLAFSLWRAAARRRGSPLTLAVVVEAGADLDRRLERAQRILEQEGEIADPTGIYLSPEPLAAAGEVAFLFPGQGSQYPGMLRDLAVHFPEARQAFEEFDEALAGLRRRSLSRMIFPPPTFTDEERQRQSAALTETDVAQPALGAAGTAMMRVLEAFGVRPAMAAGHSYGEYVALHAADVFDARTLAILSEARGRSILEAAREDLGTMAAVPAGRQQVEALVASRDDVWIANLNAPAQTVISGTRRGIQEVVERMKGQGVEAKILPVACAFHSSLVAPARDRLARVLEGQPFRPPVFKVFSNTTATAYPQDGRATATLLTEHLVNPVLFADEVKAMHDAGARIFVEAGPRGVLSSLARQSLEGRPHLAVSTDAPGRHGLLQLLHALGMLAAHGVDVDLERIFRGRPVRGLNLKALAEETRRQPLPPTTWMVNGGRARPLKEVTGSDGSPLRPQAPPPVKLPSALPAAAAPSPSPSAGPSGPAPVDGGLLDRHQELMDRFLEMHRSVMMAALQGTGAPRPDPEPAGDPAAVAPAETPSEAVAPEAAAPQAPEPAPTAAGTPETGEGREAPDREALAGRLLGLVSERTGYPPEMLDLGVDMEADLGIDSIKRVEILGVMQREILDDGSPPEPALVERLNACKTLGAVISWFEEALQDGPPAAVPARDDDPGPELPAPAATPEPPEPDGAEGGDLPRFLLQAVEGPPPRPGGRALATGGIHLITGCDPELASLLCDRIGSAGGRAVLVTGRAGSWGGFTAEDAQAAVAAAREQHGPIAALVHLASPEPAGEDGAGMAAWRSRLQAEVKSFFHLSRAAAPDLLDPSRRPASTVMAVTALGGAFGLDGRGDAHPSGGGLAGLVKTLHQEWEGVRCLAVDTDGRQPVASRADAVMEELTSEGAETEVGRPGDRRLLFRAVPAALPGPGESSLPQDGDVVLVTGGARGITAESALALCRGRRLHLILAGRSSLPSEEEPEATRSLETPREIKAVLVERARSAGRKVALPEIERAYETLMKEREIRANLARLRRQAASVSYQAVDVRDEASLGALIDRIHAEHGRLDGVIHGAGVIEDKLLLDKSPDSFDRVFDTKTDSAFILGGRLDLHSLKYLVFFTSVSGPFGSRGQCDYAAANEVVNRLAARLARRGRARVVSINWGPWDATGMAGEEVQRQFRRRGVQIIPIARGPQMLERELAAGRASEPLVVIGGGPWPTAAAVPATDPPAGDGLPLLSGLEPLPGSGESIALVRTFDTARDLYLNDHRLDGSPVVPAAVAMELMAEAAQKGWPDLKVTGLRDLRVLKGVIVDNGPRRVRLWARAATDPPHDRVGADVAVQITDPDRSDLTYYRATVEMSDRLPEPPAYRTPFAGRLQPFSVGLEEAYRRFLFHGRLFQGIREIQGVCRQGMSATLAPSLPAQCLAGGGGGAWLIDPVIFDSGLQMVILWARTHLDVTPLPSRYRRYRRFGPMAGDRIGCDLHIRSETSENLFEIDLVFTDAGGRTLGILEGMECPSSRSFNRLAGGHLRTA